MRLDTRREFYKLRELVHFLLQGAGATPQDSERRYCCYFCRQILDGTRFASHGNTVGPKFTAQLSVHHIDGDHSNNEDSNKSLCHRKCHKSYHRREANLARRSS